MDVCASRPDISWLHREELLYSLDPQAIFYCGYKFEQFDGFIISDIIELKPGEARAWVGRKAIPLRVWRRGMVDELQDRLNGVVDICKISDHKPSIENPDGFSGKNCAGEKKGRHVRASPRAVDGKKAQTRAGDPVEMSISVGHEFVCFFCGRIEGDGVIHIIVNRERDFFVSAID